MSASGVQRTFAAARRGVPRLRLSPDNGQSGKIRKTSACDPPGEKPELFEKYLPYAMAMGVENRWSEHFAGVLAGAGQAAEGGYRPTWYCGHSFHSHGVSGFGDNLGSSLSSALSTSSTAPGSSSGSGGGRGGGGGGF